MADVSSKRYYWLKLQDDFFKSKRIKKLRKIAGGDTYTIIYLKMQLLAMKSGGVLEYTGLESTFAEELALDLDEEAENVGVTVNFLLSCGLLETNDNKEYFVPYSVLNTGSEGASAKRVREHRERKALQCNSDETAVKQIGNGEIEKETEKEKETDKEELSKDNSKKPTKHKYGEYNNVLLTDDELDKLKSEFPDWAERIERLSSYVASTGKSYKSHYVTIRNWARRDTAQGKMTGRKEPVPTWMEQKKGDAWMKQYIKPKTVQDDPALAKRASRLKETLEK